MRKLILIILASTVISTVLTAQDIASKIRLNQIGFFPHASKVAVITDDKASDFVIKSVTSGEIVFKSKLSAPHKSEFSPEVTRIADFSAVTKPGIYELNLPGEGDSYTFEINPRVFNNLTKALIKGYYFQRMSTPITPEFAGKWSRATGHPDNQVIIHPAAASPNRPAGTIISCPRGWYDAGDYNKYIVNSGITMGTLLSFYEDFPAYFDTLKINIPESGDGAPDLLNEIVWNLRWMLTMQDPSDGGVYNKVTNANFDGFVMPSVAVAPRYVVPKGTAATLDFAALKDRILRTAENLTIGFTDRSYMTVMGKSAADFIWGSNSVATNQGILLIQAYKLSKDRKFLDYALTNLDYVLGRNATGYSFVTGYGHKTPMFPHHRLSQADGIADPVPGLIVGGPNPGQQDGCKTYPSKIPDESYTDSVCSYASNEIAINTQSQYMTHPEFLMGM